MTPLSGFDARVLLVFPRAIVAELMGPRWSVLSVNVNDLLTAVQLEQVDGRGW